MRNKILLAISIIMLICLVTLGFFAIPVGLSLCSLIGIVYGYKYKDKKFLRYSKIGFIFGLICLVYALIVISSM